MTTTCNECGKTFEITPKDIITAEMEGLEIQHFPCPLCGQKYVVFAADEEMKKLVAQRVELQKKVKLAHIGKFREKTTRQYLAEISKIEGKQKKLLRELKLRAEKLLKEDDHEDQNHS